MYIGMEEWNMRTRKVAAMTAVAAALVIAPFALAQQGAPDDYRQRAEALEKRMEQLERNQRELLGATEEQIQKATERLAKEKEQGSDILVSWKDSLQFATRDGSVKTTIGGRLDIDHAWNYASGDVRNYTIPMTGSKIGANDDGTEVRRIRFHMAGTVRDSTFFKLELDFSGQDNAVQSNVPKGGSGTAQPLKGSTVVLKDAYIGMKDLLPFATVQVGHFKEPFSLEELTSDNFITFMERGLPNAFVPGYNMGLMLYDAPFGERVTWSVGIFQDTDDRGYLQANNAWDFTGRVTGLPWYENNGEQLLHVGVGGSHRAPANTYQYTARPENHLAKSFLNTGAMQTGAVDLMNAEAALVYGPLSMQGEIIRSQVGRNGKSTADFNGGYVYASYFLTGEHRNYKTSSGYFDRVKPAANFGVHKGGERGWGAWEIAARYSWLDLDDHDIQGGKMADWTLGLNWYLNPNMRIQANYVLADLSGNGPSKGGPANMFGIRFHVDF